MLSLLSLIIGLQAYSQEKPLIRYEYKEKEITQLCDDQINQTKKKLDTLEAPYLLNFETAMADYSDNTTPLVFISYVGTDEKLKAEAAACEEKTNQFNVGIFSRRDLYDKIKKFEASNSDEKRLLEKTLQAFELNGLKLADDKLAQVKKLKGELANLEVQYSTNLNNDKSSIVFTKEELDGVPDSVISRYKKTSDGKYEVTAKGSEVVPLLENAKSADTRKRMIVIYQLRGGDTNLKLLQKATALRSQIAKLLGFETWSDYRISIKMAKDTKTVMSFLDGLKTKLEKRKDADLAELLKLKQKTIPEATRIDPWDIAYYSNQLKKQNYNLDTEKVREYFPADLVVANMFKIYSELLGVYFVEIKNPKVWQKDVKLFEVHDSASKKTLSYFFMDLFPRQGKYGHAAAFSLITGRKLADGSYSPPVSSIVANFTAPTETQPSLLSHQEVETTFHEFGHIMHQTLTRAPYASLAGTSVAGDFVEAPSQMLENWVWDAGMLNRLSGHYKDIKKKLPATLRKQMIKAKDFNSGLDYTRQLILGLYDMNLHTHAGDIDVNQTYKDIYQQLMNIPAVAEGKFPANFGHMMGGYDAGYYGYLWSEVYAEDMFSKFPASNLTDRKQGMRYRKIILEQGNMKESMDLLKEFLGRNPKSDAFFKKLGVK